MLKIFIWFLPICLLLTGCDSSVRKAEKKAKEIGLLETTVYPYYTPEQLEKDHNQEKAEMFSLDDAINQKYTDGQALMETISKVQKGIQNSCHLPYMAATPRNNKMLCYLINSNIDLLTAAQKSEIIRMLTLNQQELKQYGKEQIIFWANLAWALKDSKPLRQAHVDFWVMPGNPLHPRRSYNSGDEVRFLNDAMEIYSHYDDYFNGLPYPKPSRQLDIDTNYFDCYFYYIDRVTPGVIGLINQMNE